MSNAPLGNMSLTQFDALIIGSGAGGGAVADVLTRNGLKVLVLEAGANRFDHLDDPSQQPISRFANDELRHSYRNFVTPSSLVEPRTFRASEADGERTFVGDVNPLPKTVGGGTTHADLKMPRFMPDDFHLGTLLGDIPGASFADWPVDYDALEPFYLYTERVMGVQGLAGANPFEGWRSAPFPMPPGTTDYLAARVSEGARSLGYQPFIYPAAINSRPYDGRPACNDCGMCTGFGCPSNAKGSSAVTTLRRALLSGNCLVLPETRAIKLNLNGAGNAVVSLSALGPKGEALTFTADRYVVAASAIESARLLLLSDNAGNSSGLVGRDLTFHIQVQAAGFFDERLHGNRGRAVSTGFCDFRGRPNDPLHPLGGICEIGGGEGPIEEAQHVRFLTSKLGLQAADFKRLMRQSPFRDRVAALTLQAEDAPQPTNRVELDPAIKDLDGLPVPRVTYQNHPWELAATDFYKPKMLDILMAAGARYALITPPDDISTSAHLMGTLRFGIDPATSVCDPNGRLHDVGNLYCADGALFPTSSGFNPTLTIAALATWVGSQMVFPGSPTRAIS